MIDELRAFESRLLALGISPPTLTFGSAQDAIKFMEWAAQNTPLHQDPSHDGEMRVSGFKVRYVGQ